MNVDFKTSFLIAKRVNVNFSTNNIIVFSRQMRMLIFVVVLGKQLASYRVRQE